MEVEFEHANPRRGNESTLLRFRDEIRDQTACILVDSGEDVDLDSLLGDGDYLAAVLLTHAHLDHYRTLGENLRDGAPVYAAPDTERMLVDVLTEAERNFDYRGADAVVDAVEPIDGWTTITSDIRVTTIPAGHTPGAAGFCIQFEDGGDTYHVVATGDFTRRRTAGYRGLPDDLGVNVDVLLLTATTNDTYGQRLTDSVGYALERVRDGSSVLLSAGGLTGVQYAYLLSAFGDRYLDAAPSITLVGQAAKLFSRLDYDLPNVSAVPVFDDPSSLTAPETITIAGPESPVEGSAGRIFDTIEDDSGATLVQVTTGSTDSVESAGCTVAAFQVRNHPTLETVESVIDDFAPKQVVIKHCQGTALERFKEEYESFVWATDDRGAYTLYDGNKWTPPPWVTAEGERRIRSKRYEASTRFVDHLGDGDIPLPDVGRAETPDLDAEAVDTDALLARLAVDDSSDGRTADPDEDPEERTDDTVPDPSGLDEIRDRLAATETAVTGERVSAHVVDAGDGVTLLRLLDEADLEHGQTVELTLVGHADEDE